MEETLELLQATLPWINATAKIVSRPPFASIRLAIEGIGLTPPSMPFNTEVNFDKREKLVFLIKTLASVDNLLTRSISSIVSVSEVIAGKSPLITMFMIRSLVEVFKNNSSEQIQSIVKLVDLKDPAELFTQSLKRRQILVKAAAILKGGAVRLRLKKMSQEESIQPSYSRTVRQTHNKFPTTTLKTPIVNTSTRVMPLSTSTSTRTRRRNHQNSTKGPSSQYSSESLAQRELELREREERVQRTAEALRREHSRMDKRQMEDRTRLLRQVQQERQAAEETKRDAERMLKQARWHRQAALRSASSVANNRSKTQNIKLKRDVKKQMHVKRNIPTKATEGVSKQKTTVLPTTDHQTHNVAGDCDKISVIGTQESERSNQLVDLPQPAYRVPPILQEPRPHLPDLEFSTYQTHHSKKKQIKPKLTKTGNVAVAEKNINKNRRSTDLATFDACTSIEDSKKKVQVNRRCSTARVRFRYEEKHNESGGKDPVSDAVSQARSRRTSQHINVQQRPKTAIGSGGRKPSKVVVQEVGDAMAWISNFDKKLSHALSDLAEADREGQFASIEFSPTGQAQLCTN